MAIAVYADDMEFDAMHHGIPDPEDREAILTRMESLAGRHGIREGGIFSRALERFRSFDFEKVERKLDSIGRRVRHMFDRDEIRPLSSIGQFQQAGPDLRRWIMANPRARRLHERGLISGYAKSGWKPYTKDIGEYDPDYQVVMDGLVQFDDDGNSFFEEFLHLRDMDNRSQLTFGQQTTIRDSIWNNFNAWLDRGLDDPSDEENGSL
jgi:hypothetical protein